MCFKVHAKNRKVFRKEPQRKIRVGSGRKVSFASTSKNKALEVLKGFAVNVY